MSGVIYGAVNEDGSRKSGLNFTSTKNRKGSYCIRYKEAYTNPPLVSVDPNDGEAPFSKERFIVSVQSQADHCIVSFVDINSNEAADLGFNFSSVGY